MKVNLLEALTQVRDFGAPSDDFILATIRSISETAQPNNQGCSLQVSTRE